MNTTVNMKVNLSEIWDFYLEFMDWKTSSLQDLEDPSAKESSMSTYMEFNLNSPMCLDSNTTTKTIRGTFLPFWDEIDDGILFRGTYHELKSQEIVVSI